MAQNKERRRVSRARLSSSAPPRRKRVDAHVLESIHDRRVNLDTFTIYVDDEETVIHSNEPESLAPGVEHNMAGRFIRNLGALSGISTKRPILINLASPGGNWDDGLRMFSAILSCPNPITVLATKGASSMTSIIPLAADRFVLHPPADYMFHYGSAQFTGLTQEFPAIFLEFLRMNDMMLRLYVARLKEQGKYKDAPPEKIRQLLEKMTEQRIHVFLSAGEAKEWGFVDDVVTYGTYEVPRATERNEERRKKMSDVLAAPVDIPKLLADLGRKFKRGS
ncbi:MAG: ATP-dependent Clp protease proteolytic subunit [Parcubacteria group bacterium]|nr:ATP-dependent Clp protease proteolytic subunit [Parcubacteria group bacterium]